jgi:hypothetical protein
MGEQRTPKCNRSLLDGLLATPRFEAIGLVSHFLLDALQLGFQYLLGPAQDFPVGRPARLLSDVSLMKSLVGLKPSEFGGSSTLLRDQFVELALEFGKAPWKIERGGELQLILKVLFTCARLLQELLKSGRVLPSEPLLQLPIIIDLSPEVVDLFEKRGTLLLQLLNSRLEALGLALNPSVHLCRECRFSGFQFGFPAAAAILIGTERSLAPGDLSQLGRQNAFLFGHASLRRLAESF